MKAMVFAAGVGTRLRPLTDERPKALVEIGGRTMLEIVLTRLRSAGIREVIVNAHHFAEQMVHYLASNDFGMRIEVSREEVLLDTGGGLKKAAWFFLGEPSAPAEPFIVHNVDVISTIDLQRLVAFHQTSQALATLAVQERKSSRHLLFGQHLQLRGRADSAAQPTSPPTQVLAFSGIHVVSPRIFSLMTEEGAFSIVDCYVRLAAQGEKILAFRADEYYWRDLGTPESVAQATQEMATNFS